MSTQNERKVTFDRTAEDYEKARPGYPTELIDRAIELSRLPEAGDVLEIGVGTGKATESFAERGYDLLGLDIGANLLAIARGKFKESSNVELVLSSFEDWEPGDRRFDLVMSASAFHWVDREVGFPKVASVLRNDGAIAIFIHYHPQPFTPFFEEVQEVYRAVVPEWPDPKRGGTHEDLIGRRRREMEASSLFSPITVETHFWTQDYSTTEYIRLLNTYSGHIALPDRQRQRLFDGVAELADRSYGGIVTRPYLSVLYHGAKA